VAPRWPGCRFRDAQSLQVESTWPGIPQDVPFFKHKRLGLFPVGWVAVFDQLVLPFESTSELNVRLPVFTLT
jgi:hypothetical protein